MIETKKAEGFRPVLIMEANRDYTCEKGDPDLRDFTESAGLVDHYHDKSPEPIETHIHRSKRLDYILVDPGLVGTTKHIGYPSSHEGAFSDHVYTYVDFKESKLFQELINCTLAGVYAFTDR